MKSTKGQPSKAKRPKASAKERQEEYDAVIETDALLREVGEANEKIADPSERERVIPSRPCES